MKHTPGPWHIQKRRDGAVDRVVAGGYDILLSRGGEGAPTEQWNAMFHLIAAAPELLEALRNLLALVKGECPSCIHEDTGNEGFMAEQAIAKAEGGAQ